MIDKKKLSIYTSKNNIRDILLENDFFKVFKKNEVDFVFFANAMIDSKFFKTNYTGSRQGIIHLKDLDSEKFKFVDSESNPEFYI